jgi:hypothetical protein
MPTFNKQKDKWAAKRKRGGIEYFLGYYSSPTIARETEEAFDAEWPPGQPAPNKE